ncbi:MAG: 50S ribosomal protein L29 [Polyangiaceae bacterium]|nr:50S ribosomal protein L29 [Polyangiaceae bacterium]
MNAKDLRERNTEDLVELRDMMKKDLFGHRMKNFTGQLDDTSVINKTRRDVARIEGILRARTLDTAEGSAS